MKFKYIMTEHSGLETPFIFPNWVEHNNVAQGWVGKAISAGEVMFIGTPDNAIGHIVSNKIEVRCSGESIGLKVKSRGQEDAEIIQRMLERQWR